MSACAPSAPPPDIVVVVVDTLRADRLSAERRLSADGGARRTTPNLDALAARGQRYTRAYAHSSWTLPSMASLLTGALPSRHGLHLADAAGHFGALPAHLRTLPADLARRGYRTAAVVNNTFLAPAHGLDRGFVHYDYQGASNQQLRRAPETVAAGLTWLGEETTPAFLMLHLMDPHLDYDPPASARGRWSGEPPPSVADRPPGEVFEEVRTGRLVATAAARRHLTDLYDEEVWAVDAALGQLVAGLGERWARTVLVVTADHGEELWDHGGFEHGHSLLGEVTRVPLVVAGGGVAPLVVHHPVGHIDLHAALRDVAAGRATSHPFVAKATGGVVLSEGCLYGASCVSAVDAEHRLVVDLDSGVRSTWAVLSDGRERRVITAKGKLVEALTGRPGASPLPPAAELSPAAAEALRSLGYLPDPPEATGSRGRR